MSVKRPDPVDVEVDTDQIERLSRGLSQTALATQLGVTFQQVQKYEKGVNRVGAGRLTKIAKSSVCRSTRSSPAWKCCWTGRRRKRARRGIAAQAADGLRCIPPAARLADIEDGKLRRSIVDLVEQVAGHRG